MHTTNRIFATASATPYLARFLPEPTTAVSLLDRLLHHANVVGESYRRPRHQQLRTPSRHCANDR
jgi:hypothetical protein